MTPPKRHPLPSAADAYHGLPTPRTTLRTGYVRVLVFCNSCRHQADADLLWARGVRSR
jgi:hypothetical protein